MAFNGVAFLERMKILAAKLLTLSEVIEFGDASTSSVEISVDTRNLFKCSKPNAEHAVIRTLLGIDWNPNYSLARPTKTIFRSSSI